MDGQARVPLDVVMSEVRRRLSDCRSVLAESHLRRVRFGGRWWSRPVSIVQGLRQVVSGRVKARGTTVRRKLSNNMEKRRATSIDKIAYVVNLALVCGFWFFGAYLTGFILSMSLRGRLDGGLFVNAGATVFALTWLSGVSAYVIAMWKWRKTNGEIQLIRLARMSSRPTDPADASVWPWIRAAWWAWLFVVACMGILLVFGLLNSWLGLVAATHLTDSSNV